MEVSYHLKFPFSPGDDLNRLFLRDEGDAYEEIKRRDFEFPYRVMKKEVFHHFFNPFKVGSDRFKAFEELSSDAAKRDILVRVTVEYDKREGSLSDVRDKSFYIELSKSVHPREYSALEHDMLELKFRYSDRFRATHG